MPKKILVKDKRSRNNGEHEDSWNQLIRTQLLRITRYFELKPNYFRFSLAYISIICYPQFGNQLFQTLRYFGLIFVLLT